MKAPAALLILVDAVVIGVSMVFIAMLDVELHTLTGTGPSPYVMFAVACFGAAGLVMLRRRFTGD